MWKLLRHGFAPVCKDFQQFDNQKAKFFCVFKTFFARVAWRGDQGTVGLCFASGHAFHKTLVLFSIVNLTILTQFFCKETFYVALILLFCCSQCLKIPWKTSQFITLRVWIFAPKSEIFLWIFNHCDFAWIYLGYENLPKILFCNFNLCPP